MHDIDLATVPSFYHGYIQRLNGADLTTALFGHQQTLSLLQRLPEEKWSCRYAEDKWTIKEMVQHIIDTERIFCYRALCFARGEKASLPGFDENKYAAASDADRRSSKDLLDELQNVQAGVVLLFRSFSDTQLQQVGTANGNPVSVKAIGLITAGHAVHHAAILKERYGVL
jgi:hypothetical protein